MPDTPIPIPPDPDDGAPELRALRLALVQAAGAGGGALVGGVGGAAAGAALAPLLDHLLESSLAGGKARARASAPGFVTGLVAGWLARGQAPRFTVDGEQSLYDAMRALLDAIDPASAPAIGRLVAEYSDRRPDPFFRGVARLLAQMTADELVAMRTLGTFLLVNTQRATPDFVIREQIEQSPNNWVAVPLRIEVLKDEFVGIATPVGVERYFVHETPAALRLWHLLQVNDLARNIGARKVPSLELDRATLERLAVILGED